MTRPRRPWPVSEISCLRGVLTFTSSETGSNYEIVDLAMEQLVILFGN